MKKLLLLLAIFLFFISCKDDNNEMTMDERQNVCEAQVIEFLDSRGVNFYDGQFVSFEKVDKHIGFFINGEIYSDPDFKKAYTKSNYLYIVAFNTDTSEDVYYLFYFNEKNIMFVAYKEVGINNPLYKTKWGYSYINYEDTTIVINNSYTYYNAYMTLPYYLHFTNSSVQISRFHFSEETISEFEGLRFYYDSFDYLNGTFDYTYTEPILTIYWDTNSLNGIVDKDKIIFDNNNDFPGRLSIFRDKTINLIQGEIEESKFWQESPN